MEIDSSYYASESIVAQQKIYCVELCFYCNTE